jgi:hypothetical protein
VFLPTQSLPSGQPWADPWLALIGLADQFGGAAVNSRRQLSHDRAGPYRSEGRRQRPSMKLLMDKAIGANGEPSWSLDGADGNRSDAASIAVAVRPRRHAAHRVHAAGPIPAHSAKVYAVNTL